MHKVANLSTDESIEQSNGWGRSAVLVQAIISETGVSCNCFEYTILEKFWTIKLSRIICKFNQVSYNISQLLVLSQEICEHRSQQLERKYSWSKIQVHITLHEVRLNNASLQESVSSGSGFLWPSMTPQFHMHQAWWGLGQTCTAKEVHWLWRPRVGNKGQPVYSGGEHVLILPEGL